MDNAPQDRRQTRQTGSAQARGTPNGDLPRVREVWWVRATLAGIFRLVSLVSFDVQVNGLNHDRGAPGTYYALAHKRNEDPVVLLPPLLAHRGRRALLHDVHFALRWDAFTPGFLARLAPRPLWFAYLTQSISLGAALRALGIHPIDGMHRTEEGWLLAALQVDGSITADAALAPAVLSELAEKTGDSLGSLRSRPARELLAWRYRRHLQQLSGSDLLAGTVRRAAERQVLAMASEQVSDLGNWLWSGGSLLGAPEGQLSTDGKIGPITAALRRLMAVAPPDTRIVPATVVYDFITTGRIRVFVDLGSTIERAGQMPASGLGALLRESWLRTARITSTQLGAGFLLWVSRVGDGECSAEEMGQALWTLASWLHEEERHVDTTLLRPHRARRRADGFLAYAERHGFVRRVSRDRWLVTPGDITVRVRMGDVGYRHAPLAYAWNELTDLLSVGPPPPSGNEEVPVGQIAPLARWLVEQALQDSTETSTPHHQG